MLTRGSQHHCLTVNVQLWYPGPTLHDFTKSEDPIRELNYRGTKSETEDKLVDQKYNFAFSIHIQSRGGTFIYHLCECKTKNKKPTVG